MKRILVVTSILLTLFLVGAGGLISPISTMAANRTVQLGGVWAKDAPEPGNNPIAGNTYANDALSEALINDGWPFSQIVNSANFNEFMRRQSTLTILLEQWGILPWSAYTTYSPGALVLGSNSWRYKATLASSSTAPKDPVSNPTYWELDYGVVNFVVSTGSNNAYSVTIPQNNMPVSGLPFFFKANFTNTGSATLSVNGGAPTLIKKVSIQALTGGEINLNEVVMMMYDGFAVPPNYKLLSGGVAYEVELAGYALKNGNSSNKFSVANGVSGYDDVNYAQMMAAIAGVTGVDLSAYAKAADVSAALATKAPKGGDANTVFSVANGTAGNDAVNYAQMMTAIAGGGSDLSAYAKTADVSAALLLKAPKNGSADNKFSVANGTAGNDAVNYAQMMTAIAGATGTDMSNYPTRSEVSSAIATARAGAKTDVDAEFTGSGMQVKGQSGYQKLPGGVMFQWGVTPVAPGTVNFPTSFSGTPWSVQVTVNNATSSGAYGISATSLSASSFYYKNIGYQNINQAFTSTYFAVGPWQ